jgi:hypothetical protein
MQYERCRLLERDGAKGVADLSAGFLLFGRPRFKRRSSRPVDTASLIFLIRQQRYPYTWKLAELCDCEIFRIWHVKPVREAAVIARAQRFSQCAVVGGVLI